MFINLQFDQNALSAPQSFRTTLRAAADLIGSTFVDPITVNIAVGYGELTYGSIQDTLTNGAAAAAAIRYRTFGYSYVRTLLGQSVAPSVASGVAALPATASIDGRNSIVVWSAEQKALGLLAANDPGVDGAAGFSADIRPGLLFGVALHELTHAMGRVSSQSGWPPDVFDLYRFTGLGVRLYGDPLPSPAAYFSLNNGATDLADYGRTSDSSDFLNSTPTRYDAYSEFYDWPTQQAMSEIDLLQMEALGFHRAAVAKAATISAGALIWQNLDGSLSRWSIGAHLEAAGATAGQAAGWKALDLGDFDRDGSKDDLLFRNEATGAVVIWLDRSGRYAGADVGRVTTDWNVMAADDFNGDGKSDILWRNEQNGYVSVWQMSGTTATGSYNPGQVGLNWKIVGASDYTGDGKADILWRDANSGEINLWTLDSQGQAHGARIANLPSGWAVAGSGDFNGDGKADILWRDSTTNQAVVWEMNGSTVLANQAIATLGPQWKVASVTDITGDGKADIIWRDTTSGQTVAWAMDGFNVSSQSVLGTVDNGWQIINHHFDWI